jgi:hypothetical protein
VSIEEAGAQNIAIGYEGQLYKTMFSSKVYTSRSLEIIEQEISLCKEAKKYEDEADELIKKCAESEVCKRKAEVHFDKSREVLEKVEDKLITAG